MMYADKQGGSLCSCEGEWMDCHILQLLQFL